MSCAICKGMLMSMRFYDTMPKNEAKKEHVKKSDNFIKMICKSHFHKFTHFHFTNEKKNVLEIYFCTKTASLSVLQWIYMEYLCVTYIPMFEHE